MVSSRKRKNPELPEGGAELIKRPVRGMFRGGKGGLTKTDVDSPKGAGLPPKRKTDEDLRRDAQAIHEGFRKGKTPEAADKSYNRKTVATAQDADGNLYYSVSSRGTSPESREIAERLGYKRVDGSGFVKSEPKQTHAEHILSNATEQGHLKPPIRMAPSRKPCDSYSNPSNQGCGDRAANNPDTDLVGW